MTDKTPQEGTLPHHLEHLAMTADDVAEMLNRPHSENEINPEALAKSAKLATSLREVVDSLMQHHEHLAAEPSDVWKMLTVKHTESDDGTVT